MGWTKALVASSDGALYAIGPDGKRLWCYQKTPPLFQVCAAKQKDGKCIVLAGGVEQILYALSPEGKLRGQLATDACIRHVRAGDILGEGRDFVAGYTPSGLGLAGHLSLLLVDPLNLPRGMATKRSRPAVRTSRRRRTPLFQCCHRGFAHRGQAGNLAQHGLVHARQNRGLRSQRQGAIQQGG